MFSVKSSFSCISLNARGLRNSIKRKAFFLFCKSKNSGRVNGGDKIIFSHASTHSAGVVILFNNLPGKIIKVETDSNGHWTSVIININDVLCILFNVYGCNSVPLTNKLLTEIYFSLFELKLVYPTDNIIIGGDFNMVMDGTIDHFPPKFNTSHPNLNLNFYLNNNEVDTWRAVNPNLKQFSWFKAKGTSKSRIDYWLTSTNQ